VFPLHSTNAVQFGIHCDLRGPSFAIPTKYHFFMLLPLKTSSPFSSNTVQEDGVDPKLQENLTIFSNLLDPLKDESGTFTGNQATSNK